MIRSKLMTILDEIAEATRLRVANNKKIKSTEEIRKEAFAMAKGNFEFEKVLKKDGLSFICECKKASPSKGIITEDFPYLKIAKEYEEAGADCISVLTEPKWFLGRDEYLREIANEVSIPCLRKDFTIDEYMIYEAKLLGASAVLLIVSILDDAQLKEYLDLSHDLGLSAIVETHDADEIKTALDAGAEIIGVNNRNLADFTVDIENSIRLRSLVGDDVVFISESGIKTKEDVTRLKENNVDAVLIGETLMRSEDKKSMIFELKNG